eukprot:g4937.t1
MMSTQEFRQLAACRSKVHSALMAELVAEIEEKRCEAARINADNKRRAAAVAAAELRTTPAACDNTTGGASNDRVSAEDDDEDDGYGSEVLVPAAPTTGPDGEASMSATVVSASRRSLPLPSSSSSSGRDGLAATRLEGGGDSTTPPPGGGIGASTPRSAGDGTSPAAPMAAAGAGKRNRWTAAAAATASGRSAPTAGSAPRPKGGARSPVRFLEDLLTAPGEQARRPGKSKSRPRAAGDTGRKRSKKKQRAAGREEPAPSSGPFSGLSVCVVHRGSVTSNTIATFTKGVCGGGGRLSTVFAPGGTPGGTTHIVADASLALPWEELCRHLGGWDDDFMDDATDIGDAGGEARGGVGPGTRTGTFAGVPILSSEWMSECLRRSAVVGTDGYLLAPPPRRAAGVAAAAAAAGGGGATAPLAASARDASSGVAPGKSGTGGAAAASIAGAAASATAAAAAGGRKMGFTEEDTGGQAPGEAAQVGVPPRSQSSPVKGGHGARDPNVGEKRHKFFCQATSSAPQMFNEEAAQKLERLADLCAARGGDGSVFRERGFKAAAGALRRLGVQITDIQQLKDLRKNQPERVRGLGESVMKELTTFYDEGRMNRLDGLEADPRVRCLELFQKVGWVGSATAEKLYGEGMRSIEDLRARGQALLTEQQRICLNRHEDITQRMPRSEAAEIEKLVAEEAQRICPGVICQACGSYRRGKTHCGDVDVLIRPPEGQEDVELLLELVSKLTDMGFITDKLAMPSGSYKPGESQTYMGICKLEGEGRLHRRVDIKVYPTSMFAFAVLYFTGSGHFNMSMRAFAKAKGLKLSDKGLFRVNRVNGKEVHKFDDSYKCLHEKDVFAALGLEWREPKDRDGVQVEAFLARAAGGAPQLEGRVVPVPSASDLEQQQQRHRQRALLQPQSFPAAEQWQQRQHELQQAATAFFEPEQDEELQRAILLSRGAFGAAEAGVAAAPAGKAGSAATTGNLGVDYEDQMVQEALRRSVADTAATALLGGREDAWETLPPEVMAVGGAGGGSCSERGGVKTDGGGSGEGAGTKDSPVCL